MKDAIQSTSGLIGRTITGVAGETGHSNIVLGFDNGEWVCIRACESFGALEIQFWRDAADLDLLEAGVIGQQECDERIEARIKAQREQYEIWEKEEFERLKLKFGQP